MRPIAIDRPNTQCLSTNRDSLVQQSVCPPNKLPIFQITKVSIFNIRPIRASVAVVYFTAQSCLRAVSNFLCPTEPDQNMSYLSTFHRPVPNSVKFCENMQIPWKKWVNSTSRPAFHGKLWSLLIVNRTCI